MRSGSHAWSNVARRCISRMHCAMTVTGPHTASIRDKRDNDIWLASHSLYEGIESHDVLDIMGTGVPSLLVIND